MKVLIAFFLGLFLVNVGVMEVAQAAVPAADETAFLSQNKLAMASMMRGMAVHPSGDIDRDFVNMMVPHHQGAIDMAKTMLRYGHNVQLKRLAQEIIVTQQQEIAAMRLALGEPLPPSTPAPTGPSMTLTKARSASGLPQVAISVAVLASDVQP